MLVRLALGNVRKSVSDFGVYFLTVMLGVAVFYAFNSMTAQQGVLAFSETQDRMFDLLGMVIGGVSAFVALVLVFLVVYASRFLIRRRKKEFGLYLMLGMRTGDVVRIVAVESLIVGAASLLAGLALGFALSQLLLWVTSALFQAGVAEAAGFAFVFSADALAQTAAVFVAIFAVAAVLNARTVARARLIDLLHAARQGEDMKLTSLPLSLALFAVAVALIGASYKLLMDNGLAEPSPEFAAATVLVCVGTALFFYALSGFLLKLVQLVRPLYLRGLNMFTLRQLNAKVNTTFASLSVVCLVLFLAITSVCGGIGIRGALVGAIEASTAYSATVSTSFGAYTSETGYVPADLGAFGAFAKERGCDAAAGLRASAQAIGAGDFDALVEDAAQLDLLVDPDDGLTMADVEEASGLVLADFAGASVNDGYGKYPVHLMRLSQVNAVLELAGKPAIELGEGECAVFSDSDITRDFYEQVVRRGASVEVGRRALKMASFHGDTLQDHDDAPEHGRDRRARRRRARGCGHRPDHSERAVRLRRGRGRVRRAGGGRVGGGRARHLARHAVAHARGSARAEHRAVHCGGVSGRLPGIRAGGGVRGHTGHPAALRRLRQRAALRPSAQARRGERHDLRIDLRAGARVLPVPARAGGGAFGVRACGGHRRGGGVRASGHR